MSVPPTGQSYVVSSGEHSPQVYRAKVSDIVTLGNNNWGIYFGINVRQPPFPSTFFNVPAEEWLNSPDPKVPGKKNWETHQLVLLPEINLAPMNRLNEDGSPIAINSIWVLSRKQ